MTDWEAIRDEYILQDICYRKLAEKWGVSFSTLAQRAKREKWVDERTEYYNGIHTRVLQKTKERKSSNAADRLCKLQDAADSMSDVIKHIFTDAEQFNRYLVTNGIGHGETVTEEKQYKKVDTKAIKDLTGAMKDLAYVLRNIYDIPTAQEKSAMDIAAERLKIEKEKADMDQREDSVLTVQFADDIEKGWSE